MIKKQLEKIKNLSSEEGKDSKKKIENLVAFLIILIITFIAINKIWSGDSKESTEDNTEPIIVPATPSTAVVIATNAEMKATKIIFE